MVKLPVYSPLPVALKVGVFCLSLVELLRASSSGVKHLGCCRYCRLGFPGFIYTGIYIYMHIHIYVFLSLLI